MPQATMGQNGLSVPPLLFSCTPPFVSTPREGRCDKSCVMRMIELMLTPGAEPPAGVEIEQLLDDLFLAVQTEPKCSVSQAYERSAQRFKFWITPECEK